MYSSLAVLSLAIPHLTAGIWLRSSLSYPKICLTRLSLNLYRCKHHKILRLLFTSAGVPSTVHKFAVHDLFSKFAVNYFE